MSKSSYTPEFRAKIAQESWHGHYKKHRQPDEW